MRKAIKRDSIVFRKKFGDKVADFLKVGDFTELKEKNLVYPLLPFCLTKCCILKKALPYLTIAAVNLLLLIILLALWTDRLEMVLNDGVRIGACLKIAGSVIASLIGMRLLIFYCRKKNVYTTGTRVKIAALLTFLISSWLYVDYTRSIVNNVIIHGSFRKQVVGKIKRLYGSENGISANDLTVPEYRLVAAFKGFPYVPEQAIHISCTYLHDDFLPDYLFSLTYYLPDTMRADKIDYRSGDFSMTQTMETINNRQKVTYTELRQ